MKFPSPGRPPLYYGWVIVWLSFATLAFHVTSRFSFGIFQVPLIDEFGWSRGALGIAFSISLAVYALGSPLAGSLLEKKGPRAIMPWGSVAIGLALVGSYFISSLWHVYLLTGLIGGFGLSLSSFATHSAIVPRWFIHKRGRATGIALSGVGIGIMALSPIIERMIALWSWRQAYLFLGLFILLVIGPANFLLMRNRPEDLDQAPDGEPRPRSAVSAPSRSPEAASQREKDVWVVLGWARKDPRFWALAVLVCAIGLNNNTIMSQLQLYLVDVPYSTAAAAMIFGSVGLIRTVGSVVGGYVGDAIGRGRGSAVFAGAVAVGLALLLAIPALGGGFLPGYLFALIYGLGLGGMSANYSALAGDCFAGPTYGVIIGFMEIAFALGGVFGAPFAGWMYDTTGSYFVPFSLIILSTIGCIPLCLWLQGKVEEHQGPAGA